MGRNNFKDIGTFHHIGIAVNDFDKSLRFYQNIGYTSTHTNEIRDEMQKVELFFLTHDIFPDIELVKPYDSQSPIKNYLKDNEPTIYHFCYQVEDFEETTEILKRNNRIFCVSSPTDAILFNNRPVTFYYINGVGLVELLKIDNQ